MDKLPICSATSKRFGSFNIYLIGNLTIILEQYSYSRILFSNKNSTSAWCPILNLKNIMLIRARYKRSHNVSFLLNEMSQFSSVHFSRSVVSNSLRPHELQHARPPCPSPHPRAYSNSCPMSRWCHPTISSSVIPLSTCLQSFPASGSCPMSQLFISGGQSFGVSALASVLPINIQDWFPLGWTGWISFQSKGLSRVFSNTTVQKHQFFSPQLSL